MYDELDRDEAREQVKSDLLFISRLAFPDTYTWGGADLVWLGDTPWSNCRQETDIPEFRPLREDDIKVTTKWADDSGIMHMGWNSQNLIKLGVNWERLERRDVSSYVRILVHEFTHLRWSNHKPEFHKTKAHAIMRIFSNEKKCDVIRSRFDEFNRYRFRGLAFRNINDQFDGNWEEMHECMKEVAEIFDEDKDALWALYCRTRKLEIKDDDERHPDASDTDLFGTLCQRDSFQDFWFPTDETPQREIARRTGCSRS